MTLRDSWIYRLLVVRLALRTAPKQLARFILPGWPSVEVSVQLIWRDGETVCYRGTLTEIAETVRADMRRRS